MREIVESGELGKVQSVVSRFVIPSLISPLLFEKDDVRFRYDLGGGCMTDMGGRCSLQIPCRVLF